MDVSLLVAERPPEPSRYEDRGAEAHLSSAKKKVQEGEWCGSFIFSVGSFHLVAAKQSLIDCAIKWKYPACAAPAELALINWK